MDAPPEKNGDQALEAGFGLEGLAVAPQEGEVSGPGGRENLDPKVMGVLLLLASRAGHVVAREELLARLWPNAVVTDDALTRCIHELRRQLARAARSEKFRSLIETLPKRGYRLNAIVRPIGRASFPPARRTGLVWTSGALAMAAVALLVYGIVRLDGPQGAAAPAAPSSIAVLPFADMSETQDQGFLADGIAEEILNRLTQAGELRVISRTSSFAFGGRPLDITEIASALGVSHVLEGSIRRTGNQVRITAQLIAASDGAHVWSESYERELVDLFRTQDEIATSVAVALNARLARRQTPESAVSIEAFEELVRGNFFYYRRTPGDIERAVAHYQKAISEAPDYARAWAALAGAYSMLAWHGRAPDPELQQLQGEAARRAVELDPGLAIAHLRLGQYYSETEDRRRSQEHMHMAAGLDPDEPLVLSYQSDNARERGDLPEAIRLQRRAVARDPMALTNRETLAIFLLADGNPEEALSELRSVQEINPELSLDNRVEIVRALVLLRRYDDAMQEIEDLPEGAHRDHGLALLHEAPGRLAAADAALARLDQRPDDTMECIRLADVYAFRGMHARALDALQAHRAALERAARADGFSWVWKLQLEARLSPFLKPLHDDPRWSALMSKSA